MKLNYNQIKEVTQGAVRIIETEKGFSLRRFTEVEEDIYIKRDILFRCLSTAGIQLEFKTDGEQLKLKVNVSEGSSRAYFSHDIYVNDELIGNIKNFDSERNMELISNQFEHGEYEGVFELGKGDKTVRIVFPWSVASEIQELSIEGASYIEKIKKEKTVLMYGDSITHGYDAAFPSNTYAYKLARRLNAESFVKAIGGECYLAALAEVKNDLEPDYVTVAYGTNDWNSREKDAFEKECKAFLQAIVKNYPNAKIFVLSPIWRKDSDKITAFGEFNDMEQSLKVICTEIGKITFISGRQFVPENEKYYADLRLHPNDEGFVHYFNNLEKAICNFL